MKKFKLLIATKQKLSMNIADIYLLPLGRLTLQNVGSVQLQSGPSKFRKSRRKCPVIIFLRGHTLTIKTSVVADLGLN